MNADGHTTDPDLDADTRRSRALERYADFLASAGEVSGPTPDPLPAPNVRRVEDVMTRDAITVRVFAGFKEIARILRHHRIDSAPVVDADHRVIGVVATSDLLLHASAHTRVPPRGHRWTAGQEDRRKHEGLSASTLMTAPAITIGADATIEDAAVLAARERVRMLPVVDGVGRLCGVVTRNDLIRLFLREDEDIADDITRRVLRPNGIMQGSPLQMDVVNGVVVLAGPAPDAATADRIAQTAGLIPGVVAVRDHLHRPIPVGH